MEPNTDNVVQVSFAGSGGMYHYYLGIAKILQDHFELDNVIFGGTSGGCFPALFLLLNQDIDKIHYELNHEILAETSSYWLGSLFNWNETVRRHVMKYLPDDAHIRACDRLFVSMTRLYPWGNEIVSKWSSVEDLVNCVQCSSFIPVVFEPKIWHWHRDARYIDGGFTNNKVQIHPEKPHIYITTTMWREVSYNWVWCYSDALWAEQLYKWGKEDATDHIEELAQILKKKS